MPPGPRSVKSAAALQDTSTISSRAGSAIDSAIYFCLLIIGLSLPFSTKLAVNAFRLAAVLWLLTVVVYRPRLRHPFLLLALVLFVVLTSIASLLSPEPSLSWGRMRTVSLLLLLPLAAYTLTSMKRVRLLALALLFATLLAVAYTGWQYTYGIGVSLKRIPTGSPVERVGLLPNDVITHVDGRRVYAPSDLRHIFHNGSREQVLKLVVRRNAPPEFYDLQFSRADLLSSGLDLPGALGRGHPVRAQGFFKHYIPFSELLMLMAAFTFGLVLKGEKSLRWVFAVAFFAITAALVATVTRATSAALVIACIVVHWINARWKQRLLSLAGIVVIFVLGSMWFQYTRGPGWFHKSDHSAQYRELMWRDGARLALHNPWFGIGMDSMYRHWEEWDIRAYRQFPNLKSHFHSSYIQIAAENGLPALLVWLSIVVLLGAHLLRHARPDINDHDGASGIVLGALAGLIAFSLVSLLHYITGDSEFMVAFWLLSGMALAASQLAEPSSFRGNKNPEVSSQQPRPPTWFLR